MSDKFYEISIRPDVKLPAVSTLDPEKPYSFLQFLSEWLMSSKGIRGDDNLPHLFEWEEAIAGFETELAKELGLTEPAMPAGPPAPSVLTEPEVAAYRAEHERLAKEHADASDKYRKAIAKASVGRRFYVSEKAYAAGHEAAKRELDDACEPKAGPMGQRLPARLHPSYAPKVLRHYHGLRQSKAVKESDIPAKSAVTPES